MPYSDRVPPLVLPDTDEWRYRVKKDADAPKGTAFCTRYRPSPIPDACKNRCAGGERSKNWCFSCPAGYVLSDLHVYDSKRPRDRAVVVG